MSTLARMVLWALGTAVFLINPAACDGGDDFQYGERELKAAVEGTWAVSIEPAGGGAATAFKVQLGQAPAVGQAIRGGGPSAFVTAAMACGNRTLVRSAGACVSITEMPLAGQVTEGDDALRGRAVTGNLMVASLVFTQGELSLTVGPHKLSGRLSSAGEAMALRSENAGENVTMTRVAR